jgi:type IV secretory pathway ATPase VirB11/archaellum biosynthesis ATPase
MGLVRNLKKTLINWAEKILVELSYHYIKQRAKQTLRRPDDSFSTTFLWNPLTMENQRSTIAISSTGISERTIMNATTEDIVAHVRSWSLDRAADMSIPKEDARAILAEFYEWIEPEDDKLEIVSLEPES